ncbi:extracellular solute-binding protein [Fodinibius salsisoli]|uniref:Extracellular solute-binding protein n=1 Tax=Fodinibius salsisoli TaxID=2820877 RepID=A0ABT3PH65_9BACT|nr:extracellular solute-binding protein [Fodinibius salsisoli]MCW9705256.1 extracellular solute-binding protein [Fodinibius salsisoli]
MTIKEIQLKGITWNHSRGLIPMVATAQRYSELHPQIDIEWRVRSLQEFADKPLDDLIGEYDLLVIDHPWVGYVAETGILVPLDEYLSTSFLEDQASNSVGKSYESYSWDSRQWALPIDAAAPVASSRPDLLRQAEVERPETFEDLLNLVDLGLVAFPAIPIDTLMNFYMFCSALGEPPFSGREQVVSQAVGARALQLLKQLIGKIDPACFERNPIKIYEIMTQSDEVGYCPFAYGYINYARKNYARKALEFHDVVKFKDNRLVTTLGGTGLAVSARSNHVEAACDYTEYVASASIQASIYTESGGQPAHRKAWEGQDANNLCGDFLKNTLPTLERAFLRPRYSRYISFQDQAGPIMWDYFKNGGEAEALLNKVNQLYKDSLNAIAE